MTTIPPHCPDCSAPNPLPVFEHTGAGLGAWECRVCLCRWDAASPRQRRIAVSR